MSDLDYLPMLLTEMVGNYGKDIRLAVVSELESEEAIFVEDGNHGEYRPRSHEFVSEGIPFVRPPNLINGRIDFKECQKINETAFNRVRKGIGKGGDIVLTHNATIGRMAITSPDVPIFVTNPQTTIWRSLNPKIIDQNFLYYFMSSRGFQEQLHMHIGRNSTFDYVSLTLQRTLVIPILPLQIQKVIAHILGTLDRKIENLRKQNETLEAIAQTLFKHWFVEFEFPNEDGKPYKSSGGAMMRSELGDIPTAWHVGKLEDFGKVITGKTPSTENPNYWGKGLPFITPTDFKNYGKFVLNSERELSKLAGLEFKNLIIPEKSVVVTCIGSDMGKVARTATRCITNQQLNSLTFNQIKNGGEYVYQFLVSQYKMLRLIALGGSTMPIINKTAFSNIEIIVPFFLTLDKFNEIVEPVNLKVINNEQQIQTLTKTRDVLLPQLMSGKLRITE